MEFETERVEISSGIRGAGLEHEPLVYLDYYVLPKIESSYEPHKVLVVFIKMFKLSLTLRVKYAIDRKTRLES